MLWTRNNIFITSKKGVVDTLQYFKELGYLIYFITAKTEDTYADLEKKIIELLVKIICLMTKYLCKLVIKENFVLKMELNI